MNRQPFCSAPRRWPPRLSRRWIRLWRPLRLWQQHYRQRVVHVEIHGQDHLRRALRDGCGILITPNHPSHADSYLLYEAADRIGSLFYFMTAWQVFAMSPWWERLSLQHHGCFSVDRDGSDLEALRTAVDLLVGAPEPLVIFPEGDVYHQNDRVTVFREGAARIALKAARRGRRPIVCMPCALRLWYVTDPTGQLEDLMARLERRLGRRPRPDRPLHRRIARFAHTVLVLLELERDLPVADGDFTQRLHALQEAILHPLERHYGVTPAGSIPQRVNTVRRKVIRAMERPETTAGGRRVGQRHLDELFRVIQLFSYPGDYVDERASIERIAETLDKLEEDVLEAPTAAIRGVRHGGVWFGEPITVRPVASAAEERAEAHRLTTQLQHRVQELLDATARRRSPARVPSPENADERPHARLRRGTVDAR
ncbi:MAG: 1-acyl-sn-glycerol-3-phosphate acyltransferase [Planctomycetota bacterium]|nr:MAG: 1-acyl-sn-glycerol-3-phosphate acyltransferase [Planctomycetota bacterium]